MSREYLRLIYDDDRLLVVSKEAGLLVMKGRGKDINQPNLTDILRTLYPSVFRVHRIDRETSGLVVFAKDLDTHKKLSNLFEKRSVDKRYLAIIWGRLDKHVIIDKPIYEFSSGRCGVSEKGKDAVTEIKPIQFFDNFSLVEARLYTGRRHQIRVHLYSIGHPVVGDPLYGDIEKQKKFSRMYLHSSLISFKLDGKLYSFSDIDFFLNEVRETFF